MTWATNALCALTHAQGYRAKVQSIRMCWLGATQPTHHDGDGDVQTVATLSWWPAPGPCLGWRRRKDSPTAMREGIIRASCTFENGGYTLESAPTKTPHGSSR